MKAGMKREALIRELQKLASERGVTFEVTKTRERALTTGSSSETRERSSNLAN
jgi:hypothetical protein